MDENFKKSGSLVEVSGACLAPDWSKAVAHGPGQPAVLPMVCQNQKTGQVLMLGYVSEEAWQQTLISGEVVFWSRSQEKLWKKGATSGNTLVVRKIYIDCDADTLLALVDPQGPTCHRQSETCFDPERKESGFESVDVGWSVLSRLHATIVARQEGADPESYSHKLLKAGIDRVLRKLGEECTETILAAKNATITGLSDEFKSESADLLYHWLVALVALKESPESVLAVLKSREGGPRRRDAEKL
jgi:phosphoribosyl-ATP pyrophosphohydrolase/phosphoribosyl-AMP cyclohydrolase